VNFYDDGKCMPLLELLADCGIDVLQTLTPPPVGDVDLAEAKRRIGAKVCLMGFVDLIYVLQRGTPDLVERTVRDAITIAAPGGGFILGTSDSIRDGTPIENVRAYFRTAREYGAGSLAQTN
jgi:uroporphyrinogen decarboxylase